MTKSTVPFKYYYTFNNAIFKWFWTISSLGAPDKDTFNFFTQINGETLDISTISRALKKWSENDIPRRESHDQKEHYFLNES